MQYFSFSHLSATMPRKLERTLATIMMDLWLLLTPSFLLWIRSFKKQVCVFCTNSLYEQSALGCNPHVGAHAELSSEIMYFSTTTKHTLVRHQNPLCALNTLNRVSLPYQTRLGAREECNFGDSSCGFIFHRFYSKNSIQVLIFYLKQYFILEYRPDLESKLTFRWHIWLHLSGSVN